MKRPKRFEVGQYWVNEYDYPNTYFLITRVDNYGVHAMKNTRGTDKGVSLLVHVGVQPDELNRHWVFREDYNKNDWRAWRHNLPGECPCGMTRERCDYHRN